MEKVNEFQENFLIANNGVEAPIKGSEPAKIIAEIAKPDPAAEASPNIKAHPGYISHRIHLFEKLKEEYDSEVASKHRQTINVYLPDYRRSIAETSWETTPVDIARYLGAQALVEKIIIAKVDGEPWDLDRPLEKSCSLELLRFDTPEGKDTFWRSSAYVLGQAAELKFGCLLCLSVATDDGFFYEVGLTNSNRSGVTIKADDKESLEEIAYQIITESQKFERLVISKENLLEMFKHNKHKTHLISSKIADGASATVYRCGPFIDLCVRPHIRNTGKIGSFKIVEKFPPEFLWHAETGSVHRIYGTGIPRKELLENNEKAQHEDTESLECSDSEEVQFHVELTEDEITSLKLLAITF